MLNRIFRPKLSRRKRNSEPVQTCLESLETRQLLTKGMFPANPFSQEISQEAVIPSRNDVVDEFSERVEAQGLFDGNNSIGSAQYMGSVNGDPTDSQILFRQGIVHFNRDRDDYYRITLSRASFLEIKLNGMNKDADLELINSSGTVLETSDNDYRESESIRRELSAGTYYLHVEKYGKGKTFYNISVNTVGNSTQSAFNLGTDSNGKTVTSDIGAGDQADYYKFTVTTPRGIEVAVKGLSADADVEVLNSVGTVIGRSEAFGTRDELIRLNVGVGTFYVRIYPYSSSSPFTGYTLSHSATSGNWGSEVGRV